MAEGRDITAEVKRIISNQLREDLKVQESEIQPDATFAELGADSMHRVELVLAFEEAFNIEIPGEDMENIRTVQDAITYI
ncbi:MAG TPA: acyl carrier protein, partial [Polyangiaceae bacterium]